MKKLTLILFMLLAALPVFAQSDDKERLQSITVFSDNDTTKYSYKYDEKDSIVEVQKHLLVGTEWMLYYIDKFEYNEEGVEVLRVTTYHYGNHEVFDSIVVLRLYDEKGNFVKFQDDRYRRDTLIYFVRNTYLYDSANRLITQIDTTLHYEKLHISRYEHYYNAQNQLDSMLRYDLKDSGDFRLAHRYIYDYDEQDSMIFILMNIITLRVGIHI